MSQFPNNTALRKIAQKRELEMLDLTPEELRQVEEAEDQVVQNPEAQPDMNQIQSQMQQLESLNA